MEEFVGQRHILGEGKLLRRMIETDTVGSVIFYGPPGTGKTALAHIIASKTQARFERLNAVSATVADLRRVMEKARSTLETTGGKTILFLDEIHRFNKAQQDVLLPDIEEGTLILIGATTHNPFFSINAPLLSRSQIFEFEKLSEEELMSVLRRALRDEERGLGKMNLVMEDDAAEHLVKTADGDARRLLSALEIGARSLAKESPEGKPLRFDLPLARECTQRKIILYDRDEDAHYDAASAFIKSMRGSDPDAALYWMAYMLEGGEDPRFIARRLVICAAEDVGNADPTALLVAQAAAQAVELIGMPEAKIPLAQAVIYVATAPKSNASYKAIAAAEKEVKESPSLEVPDHLKDASYPGASKMGRGKGYLYPHDFQGHWVEQEYKPSKTIYYHPSGEGFEKTIRERIERWRRKKRSAGPS